MTEPGPPFVAPARYALTVLHRRDPAVPPSGPPEAPEAADGAARCGAPMLAADVWLTVQRRDGEALCPGCFPGHPDAAAEPAEPALW